MLAPIKTHVRGFYVTLSHQEHVLDIFLTLELRQLSILMEMLIKLHEKGRQNALKMLFKPD